MKIRITENQLRKVINEIGGYDDKEIMSLHAQNVQSPLLQTLGGTVDMLNALLIHWKESDGELDKSDLLNYILNLTLKLDMDIDIINKLGDEIYVDDDFRKLISDYKFSLMDFQKRLRILYSKDEKGNPTGIAFDMSPKEIYTSLIGEIERLENYVSSLSQMFHTVHSRYRDRLGLN